MKTRWRFGALCAAICCAGAVQAQVWNPITNIFAPSNLVTTGGVTYAKYNWTMFGCENVKGYGPMARAGGDFSFDFDVAVETGVACPQIVWGESATLVLGELAPGAYTLTTTSWARQSGSPTLSFRPIPHP